MSAGDSLGRSIFSVGFSSLLVNLNVLSEPEDTPDITGITFVMTPTALVTVHYDRAKSFELLEHNLCKSSPRAQLAVLKTFRLLRWFDLCSRGQLADRLDNTEHNGTDNHSNHEVGKHAKQGAEYSV